MSKRIKHLLPNSYTSDILIEIGNTIFDIFEGLKYPNIAAYRGLEAVQEFKRAQLVMEKRQALYRLKKRKLIEINKIGNKMIYKITENGLSELLYQKVMKSELLPEGKFCLVVFDIPEDRRDIREELRRVLSRAAFLPIQKSVWASPFDASEELLRFFEFKGRSKWIRIFTADEIK
jgi:DNA-binding transcriptional regulator PaaX